MNLSTKLPCFFLGANSSAGFFSYYDQLIDLTDAKRVFIIKGGPGSGKSAFMKKCAMEFLNIGAVPQMVYSPSDPDSLDAVIIDSLKIAFVDGTAPHVVDPKYPGAVETIINLGDCLDKDGILKSKDAIIDINLKLNDCFSCAYRYLAAAKEVDSDVFDKVGDLIQKDRLKKLGERIMKKEFGGVDSGRARIIKRFLSGITPDGIIPQFDTTGIMAKKIYVFSDDLGISPLLMNQISKYIENLKLEYYICYCPMDPTNKIEHIIIPSLSLAFITSNRYHEFKGEFMRKINLNRYADIRGLRKNKARIRFDRKLKNILIDAAVKLLVEAKSLNSELKKYYVSNMDFDKVEDLRSALIKEFI